MGRQYHNIKWFGEFTCINIKLDIFFSKNTDNYGTLIMWPINKLRVYEFIVYLLLLG